MARARHWEWPVRYRPPMVHLEEVARIALELPEVEEGLRHGSRTWSVRGKGFV